MIDAILLGQLLAEEVINAPGPCLYPGKFHPPHKGHFEAAENLASRTYITEVIIILSAKVAPETGNISPEQALQIWKMYLNAQPNAKIKLLISEHASPVVDMIEIIKRNPETQVVYIATGQDETDDKNYTESLQKQFGDRVKSITVQEKSGTASAPHIRALVQQKDYDAFKETVPEAAYNKGAAPKIWKILTSTIPSEQEQGTDQGLPKTL